MKGRLPLVSCMFICCLHLAAGEITWNTDCEWSIPEGPATNNLQETLTATTSIESGTVTYSIQSQTGSEPFDLTDAKLITVKEIDYETETTFQVTFVASDDDTVNTDDKTLPCTISITDVNDNSPVFSPESYAIVITNNTAAGTPIITVTATDADATAANNQITYAIQTGRNSTLFDIDSSSGAINAKAEITGAQQKITLTVLATDNGQPALTGTTTVTICLGGCVGDTFADSGNSATMLSMNFVCLLSGLFYFVM